MSPAKIEGAAGIDQAEMHFLIEKNADGIIVVGDDGTVLFANPAAEELFGRARELLVGSLIGIPMIAGETSEITVLRPSGDHVDAEIRVVDTTWHRRPARLASLRDISARRAIEERLRQSAKMEAVGQLTAGIAHDFNNLLTVVLGNLEIAKRQAAAANSAPIQALENAMRGARRAAALTGRLLAFARAKPLEPSVLDVNEVVRGMSELLRRTLGETISVRTSLDPAAWPIDADTTVLEAAILNLAVNARDAMPAGGNLTIETANVELDASYVAANPDVTAGPHVLVAVADTGMGMTPEVLNRVFEPFFTTKGDGRGTGLGLSQVYGFVKQSGGHVKLYSEPSIGTTAKLYFPRSQRPLSSAAPSEEPKRPAQAPVARSHEAILVVEDDEDVRNFAASSLRELGYEVFEAADAAAALEIIKRPGDIQLLLTDLGLPGALDGRALAHRARAIRGRLKVLIMTAYAGKALMHEGRLEAGIELLSKPFTFAALAARVREVLDRPLGVPRGAAILVVDDEVLVRMLVVDMLREQGLSSIEAGGFEEALAKLHNSGEQLAAAIVDLHLPDRPGEELIAAIRRLRPALPIIVATGYDLEDVRRRFASDDLLKVVAKPFDPRSVLAALAAVAVQPVALNPAQSPAGDSHQG
ncbi:MAG TPA: response regulator [Xanthobacteraceae bacterium]|nr:response regulator [Xanthobacteraceae bacterium]